MLCGKLDFAHRVKVMGLKTGRLSWIVWVNTMESHEPKSTWGMSQRDAMKEAAGAFSPWCRLGPHGWLWRQRKTRAKDYGVLSSQPTKKWREFYNCRELKSANTQTEQGNRFSPRASWTAQPASIPNLAQLDPCWTPDPKNCKTINLYCVNHYFMVIHLGQQ